MTGYVPTGASLPAGVMVPFAGAAAPSGWLLCDGAAVSRADYAALFDAIGTTFGAGDGATTFNLPDPRGRAVIGAGQGPSLTNRALGATVGAETHTLTTGEMPSHSHTAPSPNTASGGGTAGDRQNQGTYNTGSAGGGGAHNNMPPSLALNFIIKT